MKDAEVVEWLDHCSMFGRKWESLSDALELEPALVQSIGWVVKETREFIILIPSLCEETEIYGELLILKACIKRRLKVNLVRHGKNKTKRG